MRFQDDGGTRAWRANQATWGRELPPRGFFQSWRSLNMLQQLLLIGGLLVAPFVLLFFLLVFWAICGC